MEKKSLSLCAADAMQVPVDVSVCVCVMGRCFVLCMYVGMCVSVGIYVLHCA